MASERKSSLASGNMTVNYRTTGARHAKFSVKIIIHIPIFYSNSSITNVATMHVFMVTSGKFKTSGFQNMKYE